MDTIKISHRTIGTACNGRNNNFDFIRFLAASLVIYSHAFPISAGNAGEILKDLTNDKWSFGSLSVAVFFIISGFLIAQSYDRSKNVSKFVKARLLRIFPGLLCVLLLSAFALGPLVTQLPLSDYFSNCETYQYLKSIFLFPLGWNLPGVFQDNIYSSSVNGSLWTIPLEVFFYGVVLLLGILKLLPKKHVNLAVFLSFLILEVYKYQLFPAEGHFMSLPKYSLIELGLYFSAGMLLYSLRDVIELNRHFAMLALVSLGIFILNGYYTIPFALFGSYLIMYISFNEKVRFYNFSKYGDFSYGIYIYAFPIQQAVVSFFGGFMNPYVNMAISYPITISIAALSWHLVEKPCMRLKNVQLIKAKNPFSAYTQKIESVYMYLLERLSKFGWKTFVGTVVVVIFLFQAIYATPFVIKFPYQNDSIFLSGWLPQATSENYRWVQQESIVKIRCPQNATLLFINGYIPDTFEEVTTLSVYINDMVVYTTNLSAGATIAVSQDISAIKQAGEKDVLVRMVFDAEHTPAEHDADQRVMSALISQMGFS